MQSNIFKYYLATIILFLGYNDTFCQNSNSKQELISLKKTQTDSVKTITDTVKADKNNFIPIGNTSQKEIKIQIRDTSKKGVIQFLIPLFSAVLAVFLTKLYDFWTEKRIENKKLEKSGKSWLAEIANLKIPLSKQIEWNKGNIEILSKAQVEAINIDRKVQLDCKVFEKLDSSDLLQYLEKINKNNFDVAVNESSEINDWIETIRKRSKNLNDVVEKYNSQISATFELLGTNFTELNKALALFVPQMERTTKEAELSSEAKIAAGYFREILSIYNNKFLPEKGTGITDVIKFRDEALLPLNKILGKINGTHDVKDLIKYNINCITNVKSLELIRITLSENLNTLNVSLQSRLDELPNIIGKLSQS